jgi:hypothetical protein
MSDYVHLGLQRSRPLVLELVCYLHLNPQRIRLAMKTATYRRSSLRSAETLESPGGMCVDSRRSEHCYAYVGAKLMYCCRQLVRHMEQRRRTWVKRVAEKMDDCQIHVGVRGTGGGRVSAKARGKAPALGLPVISRLYSACAAARDEKRRQS